MADAILLEGLQFFGYHGLQPEERAKGPRFLVDVVAELDLRDAGLVDTLEETVDIDSVYHVVRLMLEGEPIMLIEAVADRMARTLLETFPQLTAAEVTVRKPHATIAGARLEAVGARVRRVRAHVVTTQPLTPPKPSFLNPRSAS